jgi:hypothetical protein
MQEYLENGGSLETISETIGEAVRRSGILGKLGESDTAEDSVGNG